MATHLDRALMLELEPAAGRVLNAGAEAARATLSTHLASLHGAARRFEEKLALSGASRLVPAG